MGLENTIKYGVFLSYNDNPLLPLHILRPGFYGPGTMTVICDGADGQNQALYASWGLAITLMVTCLVIVLVGGTVTMTLACAVFEAE